MALGLLILMGTPLPVINGILVMVRQAVVLLHLMVIPLQVLTR
jgi:hypothetical protein